jgi:hypothetical protein
VVCSQSHQSAQSALGADLCHHRHGTRAQRRFLAFNSRVANTLIGCAVGLLVLYLLGPSFWSILLGIIVSVFICTSGAYPAPGFPRSSNAQKKFCSEVPPLCSLLMSLLSFNAVFTARLLDEVPEMAELP